MGRWDRGKSRQGQGKQLSCNVQDAEGPKIWSDESDVGLAEGKPGKMSDAQTPRRNKACTAKPTQMLRKEPIEKNRHYVSDAARALLQG